MSTIGIIGGAVILLGVCALYEERRYAGSIYRRTDRPYKPKWWAVCFIVGLVLISYPKVF